MLDCCNLPAVSSPSMARVAFRSRARESAICSPAAGNAAESVNTAGRGTGRAAWHFSNFLTTTPLTSPSHHLQAEHHSSRSPAHPSGRKGDGAARLVCSRVVTDVPSQAHPGSSIGRGRARCVEVEARRSHTYAAPTRHIIRCVGQLF